MLYRTWDRSEPVASTHDVDLPATIVPCNKRYDKCYKRVDTQRAPSYNVNLCEQNAQLERAPDLLETLVDVVRVQVVVPQTARNRVSLIKRVKPNVRSWEYLNKSNACESTLKTERKTISQRCSPAQCLCTPTQHSEHASKWDFLAKNGEKSYCRLLEEN